MNKKTKNSLLLITDSFPFGYGESFLYPEIEIIQKYYEISIITTNCEGALSSEFTWDMQVQRVDCQLESVDFIKYILPLMFNRHYWKELQRIIKSNTSLIRQAYNSTVFLLKALKFKKILLEMQIVENHQLIYTYWHNYKTLGVGLMLNQLKKQDIPIISRIHRYDLYTKRDGGNYQPFKNVIDSNLSALFFVSQKGYDYYCHTFGFSSTCSYSVARLGVFGNGIIAKAGSTSGLSIISVSYAIPLKRIGLIIEALHLINHFTIKWTHFGGGPALDELKNLASIHLGKKSNIEYKFKGTVPNEIIHRYYSSNEIDTFITTSSSEGLPVSIMESMSYGVPVIGTDVGGISEIVFNGRNGVLLKENPSTKDIAQALTHIYELKLNNLLAEYKEQAFETWRKEYNAEINYKNFAQNVMVLQIE